MTTPLFFGAINAPANDVVQGSRGIYAAFLGIKSYYHNRTKTVFQWRQRSKELTTANKHPLYEV